MPLIIVEGAFFSIENCTFSNHVEHDSIAEIENSDVQMVGVSFRGCNLRKAGLRFFNSALTLIDVIMENNTISESSGSLIDVRQSSMTVSRFVAERNQGQFSGVVFLDSTSASWNDSSLK